MTPPVLPPAYTLALVEPGRDPLEHARRRALGGVEDGLLVLADRADRLEVALLLEPDRDRPTTLLALYLLADAAADVLATHLPPLLPVTLAWPGRILVDGGEIGRLRLAIAEGPEAAPPAWLVLGLSLAIAGTAEEPGRDPGRTCLAELGAGGLGTGLLAESLSRHLLTWLDRYEREGLGPVRAAWNARCHGRGRHAALSLGGGVHAGTVHGLEPDGAFRIGEARLPLAAALGELA